MGSFFDKDSLNEYLTDLIERCKPSILGSLKNLDAGEEDASSFFQEAQCLLFQYLHDGTLVIVEHSTEELTQRHLHIDKVCGWLSATAKNKWINELVRRKKLRDIINDLALLVDQASTLDMDAVMKCLEKILYSISEECRAILIWKYLDGFSEAEIANRLGFVALEPVKNRVHECLRQARRFLGESDCLFI